MWKDAVIAFFGSVQAAADAIGITPHAIYQWSEIIPRGSAYTVQVITKGKLKVDPVLYPPKKRPMVESSAQPS